MARDDYYVIVYQILAYLYQCLKNDEKVDEKKIAPGSSLIGNIPESYWNYIMVNLYEEGLIIGISVQKVGSNYYFSNVAESCITPKGIAYLTENSTIEKAKKFLKDIKEITPFM